MLLCRYRIFVSVSCYLSASWQPHLSAAVDVRLRQSLRVFILAGTPDFVWRWCCTKCNYTSLACTSNFVRSILARPELVVLPSSHVCGADDRSDTPGAEHPDGSVHASRRRSRSDGRGDADAASVPPLDLGESAQRQRKRRRVYRALFAEHTATATTPGGDGGIGAGVGAGATLRSRLQASGVGISGLAAPRAGGDDRAVDSQPDVHLPGGLPGNSAAVGAQASLHTVIVPDTPPTEPPAAVNYPLMICRVCKCYFDTLSCPRAPLCELAVACDKGLACQRCTMIPCAHMAKKKV